MYGKSITLFRLLGFPVKVDLSWLFIAALVTWSLSTGLFPAMAEGLDTWAYWVMGGLSALGLFASILAHEISHSVVARMYRIPIKGITLFMFGGVAEMEGEPPSGVAELLMAAAGPVLSLALAGLFLAVSVASMALGWPTAVTASFSYLFGINALLAAFNLLPAFPLDGGRIFRAVLWLWKGDIAWATGIASRVGSAFGILLIVLGIVNLFSGSFIGGLWWIIIGFFLRNAAGASLQRVRVEGAFRGLPVSQFMKSEPVTVPPDLTLDRLVEEDFYVHHHKMFPVTVGRDLYGCISTQDVGSVPKDQWRMVTVGEIMTRCEAGNAVTSDISAVRALAHMQATGRSRLMVVDDGVLSGVVTLRDLINFLQLKLDVGD